MSSPQSPAVVVKSLVKRYGTTTAVDELSFSVEFGEIFALLGPNGAGKTTTIEILEGYGKADAGEVSVLGLDPITDQRVIKPQIGVVLQEGGLYPGIRVGESLRLFASYYDDPLDPQGLAAEVGLSEKGSRFVRALSTGERQRLNLALALVGQPKLLFLDEPTAGMDAHGRASTLERLLRLRSEGCTILLTTQMIDEAESLADRVAIIDRGRLVSLGRPADLAVGDDRISFRTNIQPDLDQLAAAVGAAVGKTSGGYVVEGKPSPERVAALAAYLAEAGILLTELRTDRGLTETFLRLTSDS